ncbi:hypothetical protein HPP92_006165 [Vanilla planifolia]|uniref:Polynucleotide 5'-hydroxyl-kinase NOL9 n=1 Tax=Vanilla planifolia TaxID=51239 RepID=A0A835RN27_VANPL|nr:hypothetical protein HPP92_006165 [Vanilla planifolia]
MIGSATAAEMPSPPEIIIPSSWEEAAEAIAFDSTPFPPPMTMVCGAANCGKSTFSRLLLNTLLMRYRRVGYLDADVGQPEFTAPGCISLHIIDKKTPDLSILQMKTPERCIFFGHISCQQDARNHSISVFILYDYFRKEFYQIDDFDNPCKTLVPLIINTSGWVQGTGYDMLVEMLQHMSPSHIVRVCFSSESGKFLNGQCWLKKHQNVPMNLVEICAGTSSYIQPEIMRKEARMIQDLRIVAYFRQCLPGEMSFACHKEFVDNFASIHPCEIPLSRIKFKHVGCQITTDEVSTSLNGSIVGLVVSSSDLSGKTTPWCIGLGIIIAMDYSKDQIHLVTPVPLAILRKVDLLLKGTIDIPICLQKVYKFSSLDEVIQKQHCTESSGCRSEEFLQKQLFASESSACSSPKNMLSKEQLAD